MMCSDANCHIENCVCQAHLDAFFYAGLLRKGGSVSKPSEFWVRSQVGGREREITQMLGVDNVCLQVVLCRCLRRLLLLSCVRLIIALSLEL